MNLLNVVGIIVAIVTVRSRKPSLRATATVLYGVYLATYLWVFAPSSY
jgi:hypothetical protein